MSDVARAEPVEAGVEPDAYLLPVFERLDESNRAAECLLRIQQAGVGLDPAAEDRWRAAVAAVDEAELRAAIQT